jgi:uncharacterized membrane protein
MGITTMVCCVPHGVIHSVLTSTHFVLLMFKSRQISLLNSSLLVSGSMFFTSSNTIVYSGVGCTRFSVTGFIFSDISLADAIAFNSYACRFLQSFLSSYKLSIVLHISTLTSIASGLLWILC